MEALKFNGIALSLSLLATTLLLFLFSSGRPNEVCYSKGGRFLPYPLAGKAPEKASDLTFCRMFSGKTCCGAEQTHSSLLSAGKIAFECKSNHECVNLWQFLECSICDPKIGVQQGAPLICTSFCDQIFRACSEAYFSRDGSGLKPCGTRALVCARVSSLFSNGTELCIAAGFSVLPDDPGVAGQSEEYCYGSEVVDSYYNPWHSSQKWKSKTSEQTKEMKGQAVYEDAPSRVAKNKASTEDTPSQATKSEASTEVTRSRVMTYVVLGGQILYRAWKFFLDTLVYYSVGLVVLAAWLLIRKEDPCIEKLKSMLGCTEKTDAEPKKKNKRSRKKKNG